MNSQVFGNSLLFGRCYRTIKKVLLGNRKHSSSSAGWVIDGQVLIGDRDVQELHHETDYFSRSEMLSGFFSALFRETTEEFFIDLTHLEV